MGVKTATGQFFYGDLELSCPRAGMEIKPTVNATEGNNRIIDITLVLDWRLLEGLLENVVVSRLGVKWAEHPILFVDNPMWNRETREQIVQLFFEKFDVPAMFLGRAPVLAAFAMGKHSALVVDCGASAVRIGPVFEGYLIKAGALHQPLLGGDALAMQAHTMLREDPNISTIQIPQQVEHKFAVELSQPAKMEPRILKDVTESFIQYHQRLVLDDFKESVIQVSELPFNGNELSRRPPKYFEFPNGYNRNFAADRFRLGEQLFHPVQFRYPTTSNGGGGGSAPPPPPQPTTGNILGLTELITKSLQQCDVEVRNSLVGNLILTGGGSSLAGLPERLNYELGHIPAYGRVRVQIGPTTQERRFGAWIGGSILASLGTFQQLWLTRQEYKEHGPAYIDRKCP